MRRKRRRPATTSVNARRPTTRCMGCNPGPDSRQRSSTHTSAIVHPPMRSKRIALSTSSPPTAFEANCAIDNRSVHTNNPAVMIVIASISLSFDRPPDTHYQREGVGSKLRAHRAKARQKIAGCESCHEDDRPLHLLRDGKGRGQQASQDADECSHTSDADVRPQAALLPEEQDSGESTS